MKSVEQAIRRLLNAGVALPAGAERDVYIEAAGYLRRALDEMDKRYEAAHGTIEQDYWDWALGVCAGERGDA